MSAMKIRISNKGDAWESTTRTWFHDRRGEIFRVLEVHEGLQRIYEVDILHLKAAGQLDLVQAFVPAVYAEEVPD